MTNRRSWPSSSPGSRPCGTRPAANRAWARFCWRTTCSPGPRGGDGPDLTVLPGAGYDPKGMVGAGSVFTRSNLTGMHSYDDAVCYVRGSDLPARCRLEDVGASVLAQLGGDPSHLDGQPVPCGRAGARHDRTADGSRRHRGRVSRQRQDDAAPPAPRAGDGERVAVVVNELGEIGIDGLVVGGLGFGERMVELSSGCICCQLDTVHFEIALDELCDDVDPDRIVIETSGVADPGTLARRLTDLGRPLGSVITVADTVNLDRVLAEPIGARSDRRRRLPRPVQARPARDERPARRRGPPPGPQPPRPDHPRSRRRSGPPTPVRFRPPGSGAPELPGGEVGAGARPRERLLAHGPPVGTPGHPRGPRHAPGGVSGQGGPALCRRLRACARQRDPGRLQSQWEPALADAAGPGGALVFIGRDLPAWRDGLLAALDACVASTFRGSRAP